MNLLPMALFVLLLFDTYIRCTEGAELRAQDLVKPALRVAKRFRFWGVRLRSDEEGDRDSTETSTI